MSKNMTGPVITVIIVLLLILIGYTLLFTDKMSYLVSKEATTTPAVVETPVTPGDEATTTATSTELVDKTKTEIGVSAQGNPLTAYHYGEGTDEILFVGGIHGGYSWNTALVAYELMDYLAANPSVIPKNVKVTVIPVLNPDGLKAVVGTTDRFVAAAVPKNEADTIKGRFNGNTVDLNRNFDCEWQETGVWQKRNVSGGNAPFSEPEAASIRDYVEQHKITASVVWYSAGGGVFASNCKNGVLEETKVLTALYAQKAGYSAKAEFNFYEITGDMVNWFAKQNIPAISVLLTTHGETEWNKNKAGIDALLNHYAK